jgi:hypothetical protein
MDAPLGTEIPDPAEVFTVCANPVLLVTKYSLLTAGQMT